MANSHLSMAKSSKWPSYLQVELHLTELITPGAVAAELKRDAEELGVAQHRNVDRYG